MKGAIMKKAVLLTFALLVCLSQHAWSELIDNGNGTVTDTKTNLTWQEDSARDGVGNFRLTDWNEALYFCESLELGGKQDWRLPTIIEMETIIDISASDPATYAAFSSLTYSGYYWTATTQDYDRDNAWLITFENGGDGTKSKTSASGYVRAVRGGTITPSPVGPFQDNQDGTTTDTRTGLVWQTATPENMLTWKEALAYCEELNLGNRWNWRLPTIKELESIVDLSVCVPAIDPSFQETRNDDYWTSTTYDENRYYAWVIDFSTGAGGTIRKTNDSAYVRAVWGGINTIVYVSKTDGCSGNTPCYSNLQDAINAVESGGTIRVGRGSFTAPYTLNNQKSINVHGGWNDSFSIQSPNTTFLVTPRVFSGGLTFGCVTFKP